MADPALAPALAVVIPVFRHSVLLIGAIESVLAQEAPFGIVAVIVNDGCPHRETDEICTSFARAHPDRVIYLKKANGGLSSARNHGIGFVLDHLPSVEAVYLLDADNALRPPAMARALAALRDDPGAGWIYPDIDMVGLESGHDYSGPYSALLHSAINTCEAGSLIRRAVFEAGVLFDTSFRAGFEDWDFFLSAVDAGFRGKHIEGFGFLYRKRPESMLADSERERETILEQLRRKHPTLFRTADRVALEQDEAPRFAILRDDRPGIALTSDPTRPGETVEAATLQRRAWAARAHPGHVTVPPFLVFADGRAFEALEAAKLLQGLFWRLETMLASAQFVAIRLVEGPAGRLSLRQVEVTERPFDTAHLVAAAIDPMMAAAGDGPGWFETLRWGMPQPHCAVAELAMPGGGVLAMAPTPMDRMQATLEAWRSSSLRQGAQAVRDWRAPDLARRALSHGIARERHGHEPVAAVVPAPGRHVGLLLSVLEFGGVEKVGLNIARSFRARGWQVHLYVLGTHAAVDEEWTEAVDSVTFFGDPAFVPWGGGSQVYFGTEVPAWATGGNHARLIALLHWLDLVIDLHSGAAVAVMGQLKRLGMVTVSSLHLVDLTAQGRPTGNPLLTLAYEHAFDIVAPCSHAMGDWLHGMGIPEAKIVPVPNAASFALPEGIPRLPRGDRLRVLFLGRLDAQKGLIRLDALMERSAHLPIDWRVVGRAVFDDVPLPPRVAAVQEPAISRPEDLARAFAAADVLVLLSEYEGLPLTVLEAMRQGVVPLATDVGAVSEAVQDGETGWLVPLGSAVDAALDRLTRMTEDPALLERLSAAAMAASAGRDWMAATEALARAVDEVMALRRPALGRKTG